MNYLIICDNPETGKPYAFYTDWYQFDNHYNAELNMVVANLAKGEITYDGKTWEEIDEDHL